MTGPPMTGPAAGPSEIPADLETTVDGFLDGRLRAEQPKTGFRAGIDSVLVAAAVPAKSGEKVLEAGAGTGVAALCLAARVDDVAVTAVERDAAHAALARRNAERNGFAARIAVIDADLTMPGKGWRAVGLGPDSYDHAFANPPFHRAGQVRAPRDQRRRASHLREAETLDAWLRFMAAMVRPRGTITLILPGDALPEALEAFAGRAGGVRVLPVHTRPNAPAHRLIVQGIKGSKAGCGILAGLHLHGEGGGFTPAAEALLRAGKALPLRRSAA